MLWDGRYILATQDWRTWKVLQINIRHLVNVQKFVLILGSFQHIWCIMVTVPQQNRLQGARAKPLKRNWLPLKTDKVRSDVLQLLTLNIASYFPLFWIFPAIWIHGIKLHPCPMLKCEFMSDRLHNHHHTLLNLVTFICGLYWVQRSPFTLLI